MLMDIRSKYLGFCSLAILSSRESCTPQLDIATYSSFFCIFFLLKGFWYPYMPLSPAVKGFHKQCPHLTFLAEKSLPFDQMTI